MKTKGMIVLSVSLFLITVGCSNMLLDNQSTSTGASVSGDIESSYGIQSSDAEHTLSNVLTNAQEMPKIFDSKEFVWGTIMEEFCDKLYNDATNSLANTIVTLTTLEDQMKEWGVTQIAFHANEESANRQPYDGAVAYIHIVPTAYYNDFMLSSYSDQNPSIPFATMDNDQFVLTYALSETQNSSSSNNSQNEITGYVQSIVDATIKLDEIYYLESF